MRNRQTNRKLLLLLAAVPVLGIFFAEEACAAYSARTLTAVNEFSIGVQNDVYGTGADGDKVVSGPEIVYAVTEDTGAIERNYESLVVEAGASLTAGNRNSGLIIRVKGDCTINGTITNRLAPRTWVPEIDGDPAEVLKDLYPAEMILSAAGDGGNGGSGGTAYRSAESPGPPSGAVPGYGGIGMPGRFYGGGYGAGGGGGAYQEAYSLRTYNAGNGGDAYTITTQTGIFVGGSPGGNPGHYGGGGSSYTFAGGSGPGGMGEGTLQNSAGGGGAGNYGGGVVIIYCGGTLTVNGTIDCGGSNGGTGGGAYWYLTGSLWQGDGGGGGSGGGGRIFLAARGTIENNGTLNVLPGIQGVSGDNGYGTDGTPGTQGTVTLREHY